MTNRCEAMDCTRDWTDYIRATGMHLCQQHRDAYWRTMCDLGYDERRELLDIL